MSAGESWAPGVQKMLAVHETDGELGVIYLDLFPRSALVPACLVLMYFSALVRLRRSVIGLCSHKVASLTPS